MSSRTAGRLMAAVVVLFPLFDCTIKLIRLAPAVQGTIALGYPESLGVVIGVIELACLLVYLVPATAVLGAILLTGFLGGAVATHLRLGDPLFTHVLFPVYVALLLWGALLLRDARLRALLPAVR